MEVIQVRVMGREIFLIVLHVEVRHIFLVFLDLQHLDIKYFAFTDHGYMEHGTFYVMVGMCGYNLVPHSSCHIEDSVRFLVCWVMECIKLLSSPTVISKIF